jgi:hypothetical protein
LNAHNITSGIVLNFMGTGPDWMKSGLALDPQQEDEWVVITRGSIGASSLAV